MELGSIMKLGESEHFSIETIPTGSIALDLAMGVGGVPKGRIIEIFGPVLGVVRLISSATTMLAKIGPGLNSKFCDAGLKMLTPITSLGSMSDVN